MGTTGEKTRDVRRCGIRASEYTVRLAQPGEHERWDELMRRHHELGFERFAGRGLRYIVERAGQWLCLAGWQTGVLKCAGRDQWIGWAAEQQYQRLHLIANNTRYAFLVAAGSYPNLASYALSAMCRRLSDDWQQAYGHGLLLAESFVDPRRHRGHMYLVSGWQDVGLTKGYSRKGGRYTEPHHQPKRMLLKPLRREARDLLRSEAPLAAKWQPKFKQTGLSIGELVSLYSVLDQMCDVRRGQGRKHSIACVYSVYLLARLSGYHGPVAAAQFAKSLSQPELKALGAWRNPKTERYEPVSKSTLHRVLQITEPGELEKVLARYAQPRLNGEPALAADGKRIRGANRNGDRHHETVTLVSHDGGLPLASVSYQREGGEIDAVREVLKRVDVEGRVITLDALHSTHETVKTIVEEQRADYMMTLKDNSCAQLAKLKALPWSSHTVRAYSEDWSKAHGRLEQRQIEVLTPSPDYFDFRHVRQAFRIERSRELLKDPSSASTEVAYGITSVAEQRADAKQLLAWNRGHWTVENRNHYIRDTAFDEDGCLARTGNAPANNALCNNIALALIFHHNQFDTVTQAIRHYSLNRKDAFEALLSPR